jgi:hypothetical protein
MRPAAPAAVGESKSSFEQACVNAHSSGQWPLQYWYEPKKKSLLASFVVLAGPLTHAQAAPGRDRWRKELSRFLARLSLLHSLLPSFASL